jgi:polyphosphate kinase 2 (PPK2 family)
VHLPTAGEVVLFDRSWYNRAGVERVTGFLPSICAIFLREAPEFEGLLVRDGIAVQVLPDDRHRCN